MYNVLIVDDHESTLDLLGEQLGTFGDICTPIYANNGLEALDIMNRRTISVLVTDHIMPGKYNGLDLIEHIEKNNLNIPSIVITSSENKEEIEHVSQKASHLFIKPVQVGDVVDSIIEILNEHLTQHLLNDPLFISFLQLLEKKKKNCLLEISDSKSEVGLLYLQNGKLYDAVYKGIRGKEAACLLIAMEHLKVNIKKLPNNPIPERINDDMMSIITEAKQLKGDVERKKEDGKQTGEVLSRPKQKEGMIMSLEQQLESLRSIKGYKASGLMNYTGEVLAVDSVDEDVDLENVGAVFNDIFRSSHEAAGKVGLKACNELAMKTPNGLIIMACSGVDAPVHFHMIAIMDKDGNQALVKMQFDKMIAKITDELS